MDPTGRDPEIDLTGSEEWLSRLRPAPVALDRDRLLFEAGRAAGRAEWRGRAGSALAAMFALIAVGLGGLLAHERGLRKGLEGTVARFATRAPSVPHILVAPSDDSPFDQAEPNSYLVLTRNFLSGGMDSMPSKRTGVPPAPASIGPTPTPGPFQVRGLGELLEL